MYNGIYCQFLRFCVFFAVGTVSSMIFDTFRAFDILKKPGMFFSLIKDVLFWFFVTIMVFATCLKFTNGEIRIYMLVGILLGACVYFKTVSKYVVRIFCFLFFVVKKMLYALLVVPFKFIFGLINKPVFIALSFSKKSMSKLFRNLKFKLKVLKKFKR